MNTLIKEVDDLCMKYRGEDTMICDKPDDLEWLCKQLVQWPIRVDNDKTTNCQFIMMSAARTMALQAQVIDYLKSAIKILNKQTSDLVKEPRVLTGYPDEGLKEQVRPFGETFNGFEIIRDHFGFPIK